MKQRAFKTRITSDGGGWVITDAVTGAELATIELPDDAETTRKLALYGLKQAVADGGAKDAGTTANARLRAMLARYNAIVAGTWDFRDGTGSGSMVDGDIFRALVALGITPDTPDQRAKWKTLPAPKRRAIGNRDDVRGWIADNLADVDADAALDEFNSGV